MLRCISLQLNFNTGTEFTSDSTAVGSCFLSNTRDFVLTGFLKPTRNFSPPSQFTQRRQWKIQIPLLLSWSNWTCDRWSPLLARWPRYIIDLQTMAADEAGSSTDDSTSVIDIWRVCSAIMIRSKGFSVRRESGNTLNSDLCWLFSITTCLKFNVWGKDAQHLNHQSHQFGFFFSWKEVWWIVLKVK